MSIYIIIGIFCLILILTTAKDFRDSKLRREGKLGCEYCGRYPTCGECGRCGDSSCNSGCMFCVRQTGWRKFAPIPMKIPQSQRTIEFPKEGNQ